MLAGRRFHFAAASGERQGDTNSPLQKNTDRVRMIIEPANRAVRPGLVGGSVRTMNAFGCLFFVLLGWILVPLNATAQDTVVEWMAFECRTERCLVLNAYRSETPVADSLEENDVAPQLDRGQIAPVFLRLPIRSLPKPTSLQPFLETIGAGSLSELARMAPQLSQEAPGSSDFALWHALVRALRTGRDLDVGSGRVYARRVHRELRRTYAAQGYPTEEKPVFPHLVRGVLSVFENGDRIADSLYVVNMGDVQYGTPHYKAVRFVNLGSRPARLYANSNVLSGGSVTDMDVVLPPGAEASRLLRFEAGLLSILTRRTSAAVAYESMGTRRDVLRLEGTRQAAGPGALLSLARIQVEKHVGYWSELPLYRYAALLVGLGLFCLVIFLVSVGRATIWASFQRMFAHSARVLLDPRRFVLPRLRELSHRMSALFGSVQSFWKSVRSVSRQGRVAVSRRLAEARAESTNGLVSTNGEAVRVPWSTTSTRRAVDSLLVPASQLSTSLWTGLKASVADRAHLLPRVRTALLSPEIELPPSNIEPADARSCVDRFRQLSHLMSGDNGEITSDVPAAELRREATRIARSFDADLRSGRLPPTVEHFQILWALRLLAAVLSKPNTDTRSVLQQWISGADKVLEHRCQQGVGPTNREFMGLARELDT